MHRLLERPVRLFLMAFVAVGLVLPVPLASRAIAAPSAEDAWVVSTLGGFELSYGR